MVKRRTGRQLTQLADKTGIERERLIAFRRGGELPPPDLQRLSYKLLHRQAKYRIETDTLTANDQP